MARAFLWTLALVAAAAACGGVPQEPLKVERGLLTVTNDSASEWRDVEIWVNRYYRVAVPAIAAESRFQVPLSSFVSGWGDRFDGSRTLLNDLRLTAKTSEGHPIDLNAFERKEQLPRERGK